MVRRALSVWFLPRRRRLGNGVGLEPLGEDAFLETLAVIAIIAVLVAFAYESYRPVLHKAAMAEAANLMVVDKTEIATELAVTGRLPETIPTRDSPFNSGGKYFAAVDWRDGEIVLPLRHDALRGAMAADTLTLSFRVARAPEPGPVLILCGNSRAPDGFEAAPVRHTSVPSQFLPFFCRV